MNKEKVYTITNVPTPNSPVIFDPDICTGCNVCVETCQMDVFIPNTEKRNPPIILYPDECIYCSACIAECPKPGAIRLNRPLVHRIHWKRKVTD